MSVVAVERLNLDGDGDAFDLIPEIEAAFGISFDRHIGWMTAGDILREIEERIPVGQAPGLCATSMTFYRLRRAVREVLDLSPHPKTLLSEVLGSNASATAKRLAAASGLRIAPPSLSWRGGLGCLILLASALLLLLGFKSVIGWLAVAGFVGVVLLKTDPGHYLETTFGDWTRKIAHQNAGQLIALGADKRSKSLWNSIASMLEDVSGVPADRIGPDTLLWPREKKRAA